MFVSPGFAVRHAHAHAVDLVAERADDEKVRFRFLNPKSAGVGFDRGAGGFKSSLGGVDRLHNSNAIMRTVFNQLA